MNKTCFPKTKRPGFSFPRIFFLWLVYGCVSLPGGKQHMKVLVRIFSTQYRPKTKFQKVGRNFTSFGLVFNKISEKFSQNSFFPKFHVKISTEFWAKHDKFQIKRMTIHLGKKSNSFTHKQTFHSTLTVINKKFISILVGLI